MILMMKMSISNNCILWLNYNSFTYMVHMFQAWKLNSPGPFTLLSYIPWKLNVALFRSSCSQMTFKIGVLTDFTNFRGKQLCWSLLIKMQLSASKFEKRLQHSSLPVKFVKLLRTLYFTEHLQWLLLIVFARNFLNLQVTILGISISLFDSTALFMVWKLKTVLILNLVTGISFPCNKNACALRWHRSTAYGKMVAYSNTCT